MIHLFIDTNILLNFYSFEGDKIDQLTRLIAALGQGNISLHLPQQVINELARNREQRIKTANEQFLKEPMQTAIPRHIQSYEQSADYLRALETAKELRKKLVNLVVADASNHSLQPDLLIRQLFDKAIKYDEDEQIFLSAIQRMQKGNPPGKVGSVGDQYNWEMLLQAVPSSDLYIVSKDGDYVSLLNKSLPHPFLKEEWKNRKGCDLHVYAELKSFLDRYEQILAQPAPVLAPPPVAVEEELPIVPVEVAEVLGADDGVIEEADAIRAIDGVYEDVDGLYAEKVAAVDTLVDSRSFAQTHAAISRLNYYREILNTSDAERLINAAVNNEQVRWIATDSDVYTFFAKLLLEHPNIDPDLFRSAAYIFGLEPEPVDPFFH